MISICVDSEESASATQRNSETGSCTSKSNSVCSRKANDKEKTQVQNTQNSFNKEQE